MQQKISLIFQRKSPNSALFLMMIWYFLLSTSVFSQNLIPNPSFEEVNTCYKYHEECAPKGWRSTNLKNFYYIEYLSGVKQAVPPADGTKSVAFTLYFEGKAYERKFAQAALICELKKGAQYRLKLHYLIKKAGINSFGIHFAESLKTYHKNDVFKNVKPQIVIETDRKVNAGEWATFETIYTANGGEKGIIIGNFKGDENTKIIPSKDASKKEFNTERKKRIYYRFDQISLIPLNESAISGCNYALNLETIYKDSIRHILENPIVINEQGNEEEITAVETNKLTEKSIENKSLIIGKDTIETNEVFTLQNIHFETNSARLLRSSYINLEKLVQIMNYDRYLRLKIIGHTDDIGGGNFNQMLSELRAKSVANFLIKKGIKSTRLRAYGMGENKPLMGNETVTGRSKNRRVEFIFEE